MTVRAPTTLCLKFSMLSLGISAAGNPSTGSNPFQSGNFYVNPAYQVMINSSRVFAVPRVSTQSQGGCEGAHVRVTGTRCEGKSCSSDRGAPGVHGPHARAHMHVNPSDPTTTPAALMHSMNWMRRLRRQLGLHSPTSSRCEIFRPHIGLTRSQS